MSDPVIEFQRLSDVAPEDLIGLMNDPRVRRHLPLARGAFGPAECARLVAAKERLWAEHGYGPWAFVIDGEFAGWGGLQQEGDDVDLGLVLRPKYWGAGRGLYERFVADAFERLHAPSVVILLPPSRTRVRGMVQLGFRPDGEVEIAGERFLRYRLTAPRGRTAGDQRRTARSGSPSPVSTTATTAPLPSCSSSSVPGPSRKKKRVGD